jgi:hypothetical protein
MGTGVVVEVDEVDDVVTSVSGKIVELVKDVVTFARLVICCSEYVYLVPLIVTTVVGSV